MQLLSMTRNHRMRTKPTPLVPCRIACEVRSLLAIGFAILFLLAAPCAQAIMVAPHALFIDHHVRSTVFYIHNPDDHPVEVSVEVIYGYPKDDGKGGVRVFLEKNPDPSEPSCAAWVKALPRRMILQPGQRQAVRLLASPPFGLLDGEYWSRVAITSVEAAEPEAIANDQSVKVGLTLATRTVISLNYRKGPMTSSVELGVLEARLQKDAAVVTVDLKRTGSAAWLGQMDAVLEDAGGHEVQTWSRALAVYTSVHRVLRLPLEHPLYAGRYILSLRLSTDREDLPPEGVLPSGAILRSMALVYGGSAQTKGGN